VGVSTSKVESNPVPTAMIIVPPIMNGGTYPTTERSTPPMIAATVAANIKGKD
jgi:hypothetical protein